MAKYVHRLVETTYVDVVFEADDYEQAEEVVAKLQGTDAYSRFLWGEVLDSDGEIDTISIGKSPYREEYVTLTHDDIERMLKEG